MTLPHESAVGPLPVTHFTTDWFAPPDRHEAWANRDWPAIGPIFDAIPLGSFHNHSTRFALGGLAVHRSDMAAQRYHRSAARAKREGVDGLIVEILLTGETRGIAAGRAIGNVAGGMIFNDLAQGHSHVSSDTQTLLVSVPRTLAVRNKLDPAALHGHQVSPAATRLVQSHLTAVHAALPSIDAAGGERLGQIALDLIGVALDLDGRRAPVARSEAHDTARLLRAKDLVATHLHAPALGVAWLCARLGMSRSQLYRMFEADGGIQTYIRNARLDRIRAILVATDAPESLANLAQYWGFSDGAHLSRLFRARFGMSPSDYRELHRGG